MNYLFTNIGTIVRNSVRSLGKSKALIPQNGASNFIRSMHTFKTENFLQCTSLWFMPVRNNVRNHFPRPRETKRIKVHGWRARMATLNGRKILMRRILRGKHVLSH